MCKHLLRMESAVYKLLYHAYILSLSNWQAGGVGVHGGARYIMSVGAVDYLVEL